MVINVYNCSATYLNMEMVEMTKGQIDFNDVNVGIQERLTFNGD